VSVSTSVVRDLPGEPLYFVCQIENITERKASSEALAHQAIHDPLTGLPNRLLFAERLSRELARAAPARAGGPCSSSTRPVQTRQRQPSVTLAATASWSRPDRLGSAWVPRHRRPVRGDEFVVLCQNVSSEETAELLAERIAQAIARPVALVEGEVFVDRSIGITLSAVTATRRRPAAQRRRRHVRARTRRAPHELFDARTHHRRRRPAHRQRLHRAIERGELRMHYSRS